MKMRETSIAVARMKIQLSRHSPDSPPRAARSSEWLSEWRLLRRMEIAPAVLPDRAVQKGSAQQEE
jgi:hypothetical protein